MRPYRVLFTSSAWALGGGETNIAALLNTIDTARFEPYLLFHPSSALDEYLDPGRTTAIPFEFSDYSYRNAHRVAYKILTMAALHFRHRLDLIYVNTYIDLKFILPIKQLIRVPIVAHIHSEVDDNALRWLRINSCDKVLFPSRAMMSSALENSPWVQAWKFAYVHNAIDTDTFRPGLDVGPLRRELGLRDDLPVVGEIATLKRGKGQHLLLEAIHRLRQRGIRAHFLIVGADARPDDSFLARLQRQAAELEIEDCVQFLGKRRDIPQIMNLCDLVVLPSLREGLPRVVLEAMACGTPVVASALECMFEIFEDGHGGSLFQVNGVDAFAERMARYFEHPDWWEQQKRSALQIIQQRFRQEQHTRAIEDHLVELLEREGRRS